jgi:hypothetical protein
MWQAALRQMTYKPIKQTTMTQRQRFQIKYRINYASGKSFQTTQQVHAVSRQGAIDMVKWLRCGKDISILSVDSLGYFGSEIVPDYTTLGDY